MEYSVHANLLLWVQTILPIPTSIGHGHDTFVKLILWFGLSLGKICCVYCGTYYIKIVV
jgi:hypothetical protein